MENGFDMANMPSHNDSCLEVRQMNQPIQSWESINDYTIVSIAKLQGKPQSSTPNILVHVPHTIFTQNVKQELVLVVHMDKSPLMLPSSSGGQTWGGKEKSNLFIFGA